MDNLLETPQVILGVNYKGIFADFEGLRTGNKSKYTGVAEWYNTSISDKYLLPGEVPPIFLSTIENSDILSFTHRFNSDSPADQGLFIIEVLDAANVFESKFLSYFYSEPWQYTIVNDSTNSEEYTAAPLGDLTWEYVPPRLERTGRRGAGGSPSSKSVMITFGSGNDARNWAPVQKAKLVTIEYGLTNQGVRKLILKFASNVGLLVFNEEEKVKDYLLANANTNIEIKEPFIVSEKTTPVSHLPPVGGNKPYDELTVNRPDEVVLNILRKSFAQSTKGKVVLLLDYLRKSLRKEWLQACVAAVAEYLPSGNADLAQLRARKTKGTSQFGKIDNDAIAQEFGKTLADYSGGGDLELKTEFDSDDRPAVLLKNMTPKQQRLFDIENYDLLNSPELGGYGTRARLDAKAIMRALGHPDFPNSHWKRVVTQKEWDGFLPDYFQEALSIPGNRVWELGQATGRILHDIAGDAIPFVSERPLKTGADHITDIRNENFADDVAEGRTELVLRSVYDKTPRRNTPGGRAFIQGISRRIGVPGWAQKDYKGGFIDIHGRIGLVTGIKIPNLEFYKIYTSAAQRFFTKMGMDVVSQKVSGEAKADAPLTGQQGDDFSGKTKDVIDSNIRQIDIKINAKDVRELKEHIDGILNFLGQNVALDPYISCFSELSLMERVMREGALPPPPESLFIVASRPVFASLLDGTDLDKDDETRENPGYILLKKAFQGFKANEPKQEEQFSSFGALFGNPEADATRLYNSSDGDRNYLTLYGDKEYANNEEINAELAKKNIPVFKYGIENSNILDFNFNLTPWYGHMLDLIPRTLSNSIQIESITEIDEVKKLISWYKKGRAITKLNEDIDKWFDDFADFQFLKENSPSPFGLEDIPGTSPHKDAAFIFNNWLGIDPLESLTTFKAFGEKKSPIPNSVTKKAFRDLIIRNLKAILGKPHLATSLLFSPENQDQITNDLLTIRNKMAGRTFLGKIKTLPLFPMMSVAKSLGTTALLYFVEPEILASNQYIEKGARSTWLSGEYNIVGYEVKITGLQVETSFNLLKNPNTVGV